MTTKGDRAPLSRSSHTLASIVLVLIASSLFAMHSIRSSERPISAAALPDARIDLNSATADELTLLPRIGETLSQRIVDDRAAHGPFADLDALDRVHGIGPRTIKGIEPYATANADPGAP